MTPARRKHHDWRQILGEEFLSIFLSIGLLVGVLFMLASQTVTEHRIASQKALDTAAFGISTYADSLSAILTKADSVALLAARRLSDTDTMPVPLQKQMTAIVQDDSDITGFIHILETGVVSESFTFQNITEKMLDTDVILSRHRDAWIEPAFLQSGELGLKANEIATERGIWRADGSFAGIVIILVSVGSPYENTPLEKFLTEAKIRVAGANSENILTNQYALADTVIDWVEAPAETAYWQTYHGDEALHSEMARIRDDIVLSHANLPGLPLKVYMQISTDRFFEAYRSTQRNAIIASIVIVAVAGVLLLRIRLDRQTKRSDERKRRALDQRLQFALDTAGQGLWDWNITEGRGYFSDSFYRLLDIENDDDKIDVTDLRQRIHSDDRRAFNKALNAHLAGQTPSFEVDARIQIGDRDHWEWFTHSGSVTERDKFNNPVRVIGLLKNIHHQKLHNLSLEFEAFHDPLTGLLNRTALEDRIARTHAKTVRDGAPYSLVMIDIDHFKHVNDTYGHNTGDLVLQHVTSTAANALRFEEETLFFRLGGEEFVVLLPDTEGEGARFVAERIRERIEKSPTKLADTIIPVTVSAGIASYRLGETPEEILKRADHALYQAKENGRNQSCLE
ncbi:hypothetical protein UF64_04365 [Thalassospira sp. HJ]|uniref:GGDEF domain-containing protein n=1 Tax=Thalassospira sp. HJ TaxID=1616823 RepID=UPI0005CE78C1|nr:sensor domain-containing diguanylate cyclase [Thalassospira sp. HJ]KJE36387.1 hypothetical protein UF64_04365 [Thalassospira sp. HJ]